MAESSFNNPADLGKATIDRFCCQYLQLEMHLDYPDGLLLKTSEVQDEIYQRIFADFSTSSRSARFQLRVLKELVRRIQDSISENETDDFEVSDKLMDRLGELMSEPLMSEADEAQRKCLVTYRMSLVQPPEKIDILENRSLLAAGGTTGLRTWEAALHLGQYLSTNSHLVAGKRVLELGAGTGYLSILCAKLGAEHVTSSDGSEEVVEKLADNFSLNSLEWDCNVSSRARLRPKLLKWGHALIGTEEPEWNGGQNIDLIIGADVTYDRKVIPFLVSTLNELVELGPATEILISATQRNADTLLVFRDSCARVGLQLKEVEFSVKDQYDTLERYDRPDVTLTPFYSTQVPIRIFHISGSGK
ncbi:hypothetical protein KVR01_001819 [Diaporthe batatas]|uniref:protein-lysine N-methyltransferase n=1 Tax=Diaporthe batatas TaxID=748121 RepID=UPI001D04A56A|nr:protein-lysine N-methyltransferase [Diaporthe batatas]KAG8169070.1 hypothetical protein KVR01_001819 [Diaporthe batatas]